LLFLNSFQVQAVFGTQRRFDLGFVAVGRPQPSHDEHPVVVHVDLSKSSFMLQGPRATSTL
jgi:hypothetical protein